jgi:hypothetical protein
MHLQLQHSKPGTRPSALSIHQGYLTDIVKRLSFPRVFGTPANAKAEVMVADEFMAEVGQLMMTVVGRWDRTSTSVRSSCFLIEGPSFTRSIISGLFRRVQAAIVATAPCLPRKRRYFNRAFSEDDRRLAPLLDGGKVS